METLHLMEMVSRSDLVEMNGIIMQRAGELCMGGSHPLPHDYYVAMTHHHILDPPLILRYLFRFSQISNNSLYEFLPLGWTAACWLVTAHSLKGIRTAVCDTDHLIRRYEIPGFVDIHSLNMKVFSCICAIMDVPAVFNRCLSFSAGVHLSGEKAGQPKLFGRGRGKAH